MDWSLVLVSQGIETTIQSPENRTRQGIAGETPALPVETTMQASESEVGRIHAGETPALPVSGAGWGLLVSPEDYERALEAIRQYCRENRGRPWRQQVFQPGLLFDWGSLAWALLVVAFYWLDSRFDLRPAGLMDNLAVTRGEWWRLFTAVWLHADLAHLAGNATLGFVLLGFAMGAYGTGAGLLAAYLAGAGGNLVVLLLSSGQHASLGASGMVLGSVGLLAVQSLPLWRKHPPAWKYAFSGIFAGVMLFVFLGLSPGSDLWAHLGGFVSGLLLGALLSLVPRLAQKTKTNLLGGLLFALLVTIPWWLALRRANS